MKTKIYRMSGAGNLFSLLDNRISNFSKEDKAKIALTYCAINDKNNFPAEGMIFIEQSENYDFKADFFNPDGSSGMMCGNGGRCVVALARKLGIITKDENIKFEMAETVYKANCFDDNVELFFPRAKVFNNLCPLQLSYSDDLIEVEGVFIDNGSQHYCIDIAELGEFNIDDIDLSELGKKVRMHRSFGTEGVNCNIIQVINSNMIKLRTFERGVERETGACGTGAIAAAYAARAWGAEFPITVIPTSGIPLVVEKIPQGSILRGPAELLEIIETEIN